ncbi:MAG: plasma-membrane proton-efflux P-type ATPase, partial [Methanobacterium sp.]
MQTINIATSAEEAREIESSKLLEKLSSQSTGLSPTEAKKRLQKYGFNEITEEKTSPVRKFFNFFWGPIPWMIEIALIISILIQHWQEFAVILILLLINGVVGFYQEYKADNAIDLLKEKLAYHAHVLRDGKYVEIPAREVVPGDIIKLHLGDIIPADVKLIDGAYITVDESALTGESLPVDKTQENVAYSGSIVQKGEMIGLVLVTGKNTYFGKAAELVAMAEPKSHLEEAVIKIGDYLIVLDVLMVSFIFIAGLFRHQSLFDILGFSLVLTIASIPVAQPAVLSVTMTVGAMALAKMKAIVSKLTAIEEMAGMDVLFSDKTGTLTKNKIVIAEISPYDGFSKEDVLFYAGLASVEDIGDPIDKAIFNKCIESEKISEKLEVCETLEFNPFDPVSKSTEAEIEYNGENKYRVSKGAPQVILSLLSDSSTEENVREIVDSYAEKGYRALGVAKTNENDEWEFVGLITFYDAPRKTSKDTISRAKSLGIDVKMVTGDHIAIARQTANEIGLGTNIQLPSSFLGKPDREAEKVVEEADGFAEVFPEHKYQLVELLQKRGKIVGMTGDGVNDAPALKKADVGIAVASAVDAAKSAADIVFTKPGLSVIINAITE